MSGKRSKTAPSGRFDDLVDMGNPMKGAILFPFLQRRVEGRALRATGPFEALELSRTAEGIGSLYKWGPDPPLFAVGSYNKFNKDVADDADDADDYNKGVAVVYNEYRPLTDLEWTNKEVQKALVACGKDGGWRLLVKRPLTESTLHVAGMWPVGGHVLPVVVTVNDSKIIDTYSGHNSYTNNTNKNHYLYSYTNSTRKDYNTYYAKSSGDDWRNNPPEPGINWTVGSPVPHNKGSVSDGILCLGGTQDICHTCIRHG